MSQRRAYIKKHGLKVSGRKKIDLQNAIENYIENINDDLKAKKIKFEEDLATLKTAGITPASVTPEEVDELIEKLNKQISKESPVKVTAKTTEEVFLLAPDDVKEVVKLRESYPFLSDTDCPDELKILVADKQTAYERYVTAHNKLLVLVSGENKQEQMTAEEIFALAKESVKNFEANQDIIAELEYYKENSEILGEHPIFIKRKLHDRIMAMSMADAAKRQSNLRNYIRRDNRSKEKSTDEKEKLNLEKKIKKWTIELDLINAKLGAEK
jgi:hypothetical protein